MKVSEVSEAFFVNIYYRGAGNGEARVKEQSNYSVWDDDWSQ